MGIRVGIDIKDKLGNVRFTLHRSQLRTLYPNGTLFYSQCGSSCSTKVDNYEEVYSFFHGRKANAK